MDENAELLELLRRRKASQRPDGTDPAELTAFDKQVAALMRDRDHKEGCPAAEHAGHAGVMRVEAYAQHCVAPSPALKAMGVVGRREGNLLGDVVVVAHCLTCGELRYFAGHDSVEDLILSRLEGRESGEDLDGDTL
jgi:hypothetical protein